jgi:hypothetical protein
MAQKNPHKHPEFWTQLLDLSFAFVWGWFLIMNLEMVTSNMAALVVVAVAMFSGLAIVAYLFYRKERKPLKDICQPLAGRLPSSAPSDQGLNQKSQYRTGKPP